MKKIKIPIDTKKLAPQTLFPLHDVTANVKVPILMLSSNLQDEINYCHWKIGSEEWSGTLLYKFDNTKFSIQDLYNKEKKADIKLTANAFLPRDIGNPTLTEFELTDEDMMEQGEYLMKGFRAGLIHTHHGMGTFFSGTDDVELQTNTPSTDMYLSLITNYKDGGDPSARLCWVGEIITEQKKKIEHKFKLFDKFKSIKSEVEDNKTENVIFYVNLRISYEIRESIAAVVAKMNALAEEKAEKARIKALPTPTYSRGGGMYGGHNNYYDGWGTQYGNNQTKMDLDTSENIEDDKITSLQQIAHYRRLATEAGLISHIDTGYTKITSFCAKLLTEDKNNTDLFYNVVRALPNLYQLALDKLENSMADNFEEFALLHFGKEDDSPLTRYDYLIICYGIKDTLETRYHMDTPAVERLIDVVDEVIKEELEALVEDELEEMEDNTVEVECPKCLGECMVFNTVCDTCDGAGTIAKVLLLN